MIELHYFTADDCGPCRATTTMIRQTARDLELALFVHDVTEEESQELARLHGFDRIPAILLTQGLHVLYRGDGSQVTRKTIEQVVWGGQVH